MQIAEMVRESVDKAVTQLTANGGGTPQEATGYLHAARTAAEIKLVAASDTAVPRGQKAVTVGMADDLAEIVNRIEVHGEPQRLEPDKGIVIPKEGSSGWAF
ncbi:MAG: hypothetical protein V3S98_06230 [Dehalococcoidia bacterium]